MSSNATPHVPSARLVTLATVLATSVALGACTPNTQAVDANTATDEAPAAETSTEGSPAGPVTETERTAEESPAATTALPLAATDAATSGTITVSAQAEVKVTPDKASFGVTIASEGDSASAAQKANAKPVNDVIDALKEAGVPEKSIQTSTSSVNPSWSPDEGEDTEDRYEATTRLQISDVAMEDVAELMETATTAGATAVDGPSFTASSYDDAYEEALTKAVEAARPKAESIAKAAGVGIGKVVGVTEGYQDTLYRAEATADAGLDTTAAIEPGQIGVVANVTVSFAIS